MKLSEYFQDHSDKNRLCENCRYIMRPIRKDLPGETFSCQKHGKFVALSDYCSDWALFTDNPADLL